MKTLLPGLVLIAAVALPAMSAGAETPWDYRPIVIDGDYTYAVNAHRIEAPEKGHIGYHHARDAAPALWFQMEGNYGDRIRLRLGVPALDRYRLLRPSIAVLGQGLPPIEQEIPFEIPEGFGGHVYHSAHLDIERYTDNYHGTVSWRFEEIEHVLNSTGRIYLVGFIPLPESPEARDAYPDGKFWMTVGHKVNFRMRDLFSTYQRTRHIRRFFEDEGTTQSWIYRNSIMSVIIAFLSVMLTVS